MIKARLRNDWFGRTRKDSIAHIVPAYDAKTEWPQTMSIRPSRNALWATPTSSTRSENEKGMEKGARSSFSLFFLCSDLGYCRARGINAKQFGEPYDLTTASETFGFPQKDFQPTVPLR